MAEPDEMPPDECEDCHRKDDGLVWYEGLRGRGRWLCLDCCRDRQMEE